MYEVMEGAIREAFSSTCNAGKSYRVQGPFTERSSTHGLMSARCRRVSGTNLQIGITYSLYSIPYTPLDCYMFVGENMLYLIRPLSEDGHSLAEMQQPP